MMYIASIIFITFILKSTKAWDSRVFMVETAGKEGKFLVETAGKKRNVEKTGKDYASETYTEESDDGSFNCVDECGLYNHQNPWWAPVIHRDCTAMQENQKCKYKFDKKGKKKKKKRRRSDDQSRIVGGQESEHAMPWMVFITLDESRMCGGSLINTQFVLTAAHCFCDGFTLHCSRNIEDIGEGPVNILSDEREISQRIKLYLGFTLGGGANSNPRDDMIDNKKYFKFSAIKIFVHPLLGTSQDFHSTPDQALVKMDKRVQSFKANIRPICLSTANVMEKPNCPDNSKQGCAMVAGWGNRFNFDEYDKDGYQIFSECKTNTAGMSPDKVAFCQERWTVKRANVTNCTKEDIPIKDLSQPCRLLTKELNFQDQLSKRRTGKSYPTVDRIVKHKNAPIDLQYKPGRNYFCGRTRFTSEEKRNGVLKNGWCATKLDKKEKIESYGFCDSACRDERKGFMFASLNILTDEECTTLYEHQIAKNENNDMGWNAEYEICTGKKHKFPENPVHLVRFRKSKRKLNAEKALAKKLGVPKGYRPTKYTFKKGEKVKKNSLGMAEDYPYDWYIGAVDSCQGDSGGPLWRNIKDSTGKIKATQIGTVSRGSGCASFNNPAVFGSIKKSFNWIKEVVQQEMKKEDFCPNI